MYKYTFLNLTYSLNIILLVCMFTWLIIWHWTTSWCILYWGKPLLFLPAFLGCPQFYVQGWSSWFFFCLLWHVHWYHSFSAHAFEVMLDLFAYFLTLLKDSGNSLVLWLLNSFFPLLAMSPELWEQDCSASIGIVLCRSFYPLQREASLLGMKNTLISELKDRCL